MSKFAIVDTETTGLDFGKDKVVEVAYIILDEDLQVINYGTSFIDPAMPIPHEVSAIHHITDKHVADAPTLADYLRDHPLNNVEVMVAHNMAFDRRFLPMYGEKPWICTLKNARKYWPDAPNHKNQFLRYHLGVEVPPEAGEVPHRALFDTFTTLGIFKEIVKLTSIEELIDTSSKPSLIKMIMFGKNKGKLWAEVDRGYLRWVLNSSGFDPDVTYTAKYYYDGGKAPA